MTNVYCSILYNDKYSEYYLKFHWQKKLCKILKVAKKRVGGLSSTPSKLSLPVTVFEQFCSELIVDSLIYKCKSI